MANDDVLAPIDFLAVEFPGGRVTGDSFAHLLDLVERDVVRVLDMEFVAKAADGSVAKVALGDVEHVGEVDARLWDGVSSGILDQADIDTVAAAIDPGSLASILVYENVWAAPLYVAIDRSDARVIGAGPVEVNDLVDALD